MGKNRRLTRGAAAGVVAATAVLTLGTGWTLPVDADAPVSPPPTPIATTPTTAPSGTTTTTAPASRTPAGSSTSGAPSSDSPPDESGASSSGSEPESPQIEAMKAEAASVHRSGPSSTIPLLTALAPLGQVGLSPVQEALVGFGRFPVAGPAYYSDDWLEFRPGPPAGLHPGIDIAAAQSTPIRAPTSGTLTYNYTDPNGYGLVAMVTQPDKTLFLMAHMSATVLGLSSGAHVDAGQVIGFVGATGNATGPHVHFEVHPYGGAGVDAKPFLDEWLAEALTAAPSVVAEYTGQAPPAVTAPPVSVPAAAPVSEPTPTLRGHLVSRPGRSGGEWVVAVARGVGVVGAVSSVMLTVDRLRRRRTRTAV